MYYYDSWGGHWDGKTTQSTDAEIIFADDYRCITAYCFSEGVKGSKAQRDTNYYYYELDYPYINLYNVYGFFRWDFTQDTAFIRASTKEELQTQVTGKAGVLKFATDTTVLYTNEAFSARPFFSINGEFNLEPNWRIEDPEKYFPVPQL